MTVREDKNTHSFITINSDLSLNVPNCPFIAFIEGDGVGPDIWKATVLVLESAIEKAYGEKRRIVWKEVLAGEKAYEMVGEWLPEESLEMLRKCVVGLKGPLTTPVGGGIRSLNVTIRQVLDLYACVRPVKYYRGVPSPVKQPEKVDMIIFRENTEDVYAGIEWQWESSEAVKVRKFLKDEMQTVLPPDSGIGIKPISRKRTERLVRRAIQYALDNEKDSVTLVHKGNIMKYTEGAFREWGYRLAKNEFDELTVSEAEAYERFEGKKPVGKVVIKDRIADAMFQQVLLRPDEYSVIATPNLNGDYLSDALAAQIGGLGMAPGANIGDDCAVFEATHGTAPKYAGKNKVNPGSLILSGAMMLDYIGWKEASEVVKKAVEETICDKTVTYDLARQIEGAKEVGTIEYARAITERL